MLTKIKFGFGALSIAFALAGCGAPQAAAGDVVAAEDADSAKEDSARRVAHPELYACQADSDCLAVEKAGCCPNGFLIAVNQDEVKAYETRYACKNPPATCPLFVVHDERVAQCNYNKHQCEMIDVGNIACDGFIAPAWQHHCPAGFSCSHVGLNPDSGGKCLPTIN